MAKRHHSQIDFRESLTAVTADQELPVGFLLSMLVAAVLAVLVVATVRLQVSRFTAVPYSGVKAGTVIPLSQGHLPIQDAQAVSSFQPVQGIDSYQSSQAIGNFQDTQSAGSFQQTSPGTDLQ